MTKKLKLSNPGDVIESNFYIDEAADKYYIEDKIDAKPIICLLYTSPSPRDRG